MRWSLGRFFSGLAILASMGGLLQAEEGRLIPDTTAARHGLTRAWFAQAEVAPGFSHLKEVSLQAGILFTVSDRAVVQAFDAETGKMLWTETVGNPAYPTSSVGASAGVAAVTNGSTLYMFETMTGRAIDKRRIGGVPSGPPAVSQKNVLVPLSKELVEEHVIKMDVHSTPPTHGSLGRLAYAPVIGYESIFWATDAGHVYAIAADGGGRRFESEAAGGVASSTSYYAPYILVGSLRGYAYAFNEMNGKPQWRFTASEPIRHPLVPIKEATYVITETGDMFRLKTQTGYEEWHTSNISRFLAAGKTRLYCTDALNRVVVLDAATGAKIDTLPISGFSFNLINFTTDRIYLANDNGLLQCFHETELKEPLSYISPKPAKVDAKGAEGKNKPKKPDAEAEPTEDMKKDAAPDKEPGPVVDPFK